MALSFFLHPFNIFILTVTLTSKPIATIHFNTTGYQNCVFNLAQYGKPTDRYAKDVIDRLISSTPRIQRVGLCHMSISDEQLNLRKHLRKSLWKYHHI